MDYFLLDIVTGEWQPLILTLDREDILNIHSLNTPINKAYLLRPLLPNYKQTHFNFSNHIFSYPLTFLIHFSLQPEKLNLRSFLK